ncbi:hypothetical protein F5876DRAFT_81979 [Lentinula aff. lateritia]|uniref:Uncharacterized protein n=1 Tax=Lentinula aff. lateritia TaxID=2804960 RepID=A0ACC1TKG0_9AGAR|nr:hypothetical protein F5876DRAFT_81979 [Lentinula aff. lateritia]
MAPNILNDRQPVASTSKPGGSAVAASGYTPEDGYGNGKDEMTPQGDTLNAVRGSRGTSTSAGEHTNGSLPANPAIETGTRQRQNTNCLNIKGHGSINIEHASNKWGDICMMMLDCQIGILVMGEAHMNTERHDDIERKYGKDLKLFYTKLLDTPNAAGVAIVLNRNKTNIEGIQTHEIVPGHAMLLKYYWHNKEKLSVLAIYAPNADMTSNTNFWLKIQNFFNCHPRIQKPDIMVGDCNMVEEPLDRLIDYPHGAMQP